MRFSAYRLQPFIEHCCSKWQQCWMNGLNYHLYLKLQLLLNSMVTWPKFGHLTAHHSYNYRDASISSICLSAPPPPPHLCPFGPLHLTAPVDLHHLFAPAVDSIGMGLQLWKNKSQKQPHSYGAKCPFVLSLCCKKGGGERICRICFQGWEIAGECKGVLGYNVPNKFLAKEHFGTQLWSCFWLPPASNWSSAWPCPGLRKRDFMMALWLWNCFLLLNFIYLFI